MAEFLFVKNNKNDNMKLAGDYMKQDGQVVQILAVNKSGGMDQVVAVYLAAGEVVLKLNS